MAQISFLPFLEKTVLENRDDIFWKCQRRRKIKVNVTTSLPATKGTVLNRAEPSDDLQSERDPRNREV